MLTSQKNCCIPVLNKMQKFMSISKLIILKCNILFNFLLHVNIQYMISFCTCFMSTYVFRCKSKQPTNRDTGVCFLWYASALDIHVQDSSSVLKQKL